MTARSKVNLEAGLVAVGVVVALLVLWGLSLKPTRPAKPARKTESSQPRYTARQVYDFVCSYEVHPGGYTVGKMTDLLCLTMKAEGRRVDITDGRALSWRGEDIWKVGYVVVVDDTEFYTFEYEADMVKKTVKPTSHWAKDLWQK